MFHPSGQSPDEARIEMSGHILSTEGREGEQGSSSRQLDFKPQALIQSYFCLSPSMPLFCLSFYPIPTSERPQSYPISALDSTLFPQKISRRPIECLSLGRRGTEYGADLTRSQS